MHTVSLLIRHPGKVLFVSLWLLVFRIAKWIEGNIDLNQENLRNGEGGESEI